MPTKITVIYDNPSDPAAFETGYAADQVELAKALPGLTKIETSKVWPKEDGSPTPLYRMVDLYFPDYDTARPRSPPRRRRPCSLASSVWPPVACGLPFPTSNHLDPCCRRHPSQRPTPGARPLVLAISVLRSRSLAGPAKEGPLNRTTAGRQGLFLEHLNPKGIDRN